MTPKPPSRQTWPVLEIFGILLCGVGLCFALAFVGVRFSDEHIVKDKQQVATKMDEMRSAMTAAKIPADQISGLLSVHKAAIVTEVAQEDFILMSFFVSLSLLVSSVGLTLILYAKLRAQIQQSIAA
jgi:hypothetical protein